ncbi:MAG: hypothetical protein P4M13_03745 [Alphaproteobacteria bacterium]|nr:hypothetical protein [Alphaproteobacteria bacterium]
MKIRTTLTAIFAATVLMCAAAPAFGEEARDLMPLPDSGRIVLADATPLTSAEMQDIRGGFSDPSGLIYNFSVNVQTDVQGATVFTRSISLSPSGSGGQFQAVANASLLPQNFPSNLSISMIGNGTGVTISNASGQNITILNQAANGAPASIILNTSSNANIGQSVNVGLTLQNMTTVMNFVHTTTQAALAQVSGLHSLGF